jgi:hypothetical protein
MNRSVSVWIATACVLLTACRGEAPVQRREGPPRLASVKELSAAEQQYGHSAVADPKVTYQPEVVMLSAGADAIRSASADGLTWTLDPGSEGAANIQRGKVLLLTSRAAGRVLDVKKTTAGLQVVLGPADITEIVRDGQFSLDQPVNFDQAASYTKPDVFDPQVTVDPLLAMFHHPAGYGTFVGPVLARQVTQHRFTMTPLVGSQGIGVRIASDASGVRFLGEVVLYIKAPSLRFNLDIRGGKVNVCEVELKGVAGLMVAFEAALPSPTSANINERRYAPVDFYIPVTGMGVPFAVNVRQIFELKTAFTSTGTFKGRGYYTFTGGLHAGYRDGQFSLGGPTGFSGKETLLTSMKGVAFGVTGLVMTHHANVIVGVGLAGFVAGPYVFVNSSVALTRGSSLGMIMCNQESFSMAVGAGVGYNIPQPVTSAINSILRALNIREEIQGSGGIQTKPMMIVSKGWYHPAVQACGG